MAKGRSLQRDLMLWLVLPLFALWAGGSLVAYRIASAIAENVYDRWLFDSARSLAAQVKWTDGQVRVDLPPAARQLLVYDAQDRVYFSVEGPDGQLVSGDPDLPSAEAPAARGGRPVFFDGVYKARPVRVAALLVNPDPAGASKAVRVKVAETVTKRSKVAGEVLAALALPQLVLIALGGLMVWLGLSRGLAPLHALCEQIARRSPRDLQALPDLQVPAELEPVVTALNELFERLNRALSAQRRFVADAAHQLRTPLAGLQMQAQLALRQDTLEAVREVLEQLQAAAERSAHMGNQLLSLARAEPRLELDAPTSPVDLASLVREVASDWVGGALEKDVDLGFDGPATGPWVNGDALLLREMVNNLLDNAVKYTPPGGRVTVRLEQEGGGAVLTVEDNGPGIPAGEREKVFGRFYRVLGTTPSGAGLGLAIVREVAAAHDAEVIAASGPEGKGTSMRVVFKALS
jgi:two-component system sensor histidine kinase TctE